MSGSGGGGSGERSSGSLLDDAFSIHHPIALSSSSSIISSPIPTYTSPPANSPPILDSLVTKEDRELNFQCNCNFTPMEWIRHRSRHKSRPFCPHLLMVPWWSYYSLPSSSYSYFLVLLWWWGGISCIRLYQRHMDDIFPKELLIEHIIVHDDRLLHLLSCNATIMNECGLCSILLSAFVPWLFLL